MTKATAPHERREHLLQLREEGTRRLAELDLRGPLDVQELCDRLVELRQRPIKLVPLPMPASHPCGMWVAARDEDVIFFDANTTSAHQEHIILHELGHIICCHRGSGLLDDESARALFPNLDPEIVRDMLMRATYDDVQEQEAEVIAYLLAEIMTDSPTGEADESAEQENAIYRVERSLI